METFLRPLKEIKEFVDIQEQLRQKSEPLQISGSIDAEKPHMIYALGNEYKHKIIVGFDEQKTKELYEEYLFFDQNALYFPAKDILFYQADIHGNLLTEQRIQTLKAIAEGKPVTIFTTFDGIMNKMAPAENFIESVIHLKDGESYSFEQIQKQLVEMGYVKNYQVQAAGEFSARGGILDIFPLTEEMPIRIEFFGDDIDGMKTFDSESQRSMDNKDEIYIYPACEFVFTKTVTQKGMHRLEEEKKKVYDKFRKEMKTEEAFRIKSMVDEFAEEMKESGTSSNADFFLHYFVDETNSILDFFEKENTLIYLDEPVRCVEKGRVTELEFTESMKQRLEKGYILPGQMDALFSYKEMIGKLERMKCVALSSLDLREKEMSIKNHYSIESRSVNAYNHSFEMLVKDLGRYKKEGYQIVLLSSSKTRAQELAKDLQEKELNSFFTEDFSHEIKAGEIMTAFGKIKKGYEYPLIKFAVISESDIFGVDKKKRKKRRVYEGEKISDFSEIKVGDYVVHENHGLGIYRGIEKVEMDKVVKDYMKIEYDKGGNLYIPATQLDLIQKYAGAKAKKPKLNKLGTQEWNKTKSKVQHAVEEIAKELVDLYALRQNDTGYAFEPDTPWQTEFEEKFPFEETYDQELAIEATKKDMESTKIMDRLICGDVGFGKTEIAIRAAFKSVQDSKQVVYLAPTTILAQQIYNTFVQRMKDFPVKIGLLCRFRSPSEQKKTIEGLKKGQIDIVIGTHRVLSQDVVFANLGLLIVDEEQRFGVGHKEKIKQLKTNIDVLTLTATPIPRTLHMSLIGIRDMSVLEEPPMDRIPIQTYVLEYNEEMVREAIRREMAREGQVYYVYNRVKNIEDVAAKVQELVPDANVAYAHGQMKERELEDIMYQFINQDIDVLISTTIIETGLDISNVNTMIIEDADNLGLSQLYQLRGRVGRSNRTSYAFLMYKKNKMLKEYAEKRLAAIKEFTDLGSGFKIAMRDLEIRGAGNLLGMSQHGHMEAVGYDLYCKMLNEAVKIERGIETKDYFETAIDLDIDAYIPPRYIQNENQKLDIYKRIAGIETDHESDEMLDELIDRFGEPPKSVQNLILVARVKAMAHAHYFTEISQKGDKLKLVLYEKAKINPANIEKFMAFYPGMLSFIPDTKAAYFTCALHLNSKQKVENVIEFLKEFLEQADLLMNETKE